MEKRKPHTPLSEIKRLMRNPETRLITRAALAGAVALGLDKATLIEAVLALTPGDFYKSMTTHDDHTQWQDVYRAEWGGYALYIKLQAVAGVGVVVSFKQR